MHAARWLLGLSTSFAIVASVAAGCGGNTNGAAPIDSGTTEDVTTDHAEEPAPVMEAAVEAAAPEAAVDAACVPDANINNITVPDASFGDAGATAASCLSCVQVSCPNIISMCNQDCACVSAYEQFAACLGNGGALITCAGSLTAIPGVTIQQLACALGCASPSICGVSIPTGGDGGTPDGASTDGATPGDAAGE